MIKKNILFALTTALVFANTGKISGKITNSATGEPLAGVNVFLEWSSYGSATNSEGEYVIINIPVIPSI